jgi:hypothetical protein
LTGPLGLRLELEGLNPFVGVPPRQRGPRTQRKNLVWPMHGTVAVEEEGDGRSQEPKPEEQGSQKPTVKLSSILSSLFHAVYPIT